ncbi:MAG TPA: alpha/beta fold hydrolase [Mycobacteriales bacterium]|jgi:pimeloyl-ACP methyl ester carboxylesterase|nr:alpha/beta fold hydrolase [Mycobacteriales bacterium]
MRAILAGPAGLARDVVQAARAGAGTAVRRALTPSTVRGVTVEALWIAAHLALYPLGVAEERLDPDSGGHTLRGLDPLRRSLVASDPEAAGTPILLVHGMVDNRSIFTFLRRALRRHGFGRVSTVNYSVFTSDVRAAARELGRHVEALCAETGYDRVHVVGHSLGGVIGRYYVQRLGGDARVHTLVTMGSPHGGTEVARLLPVHLARQLRRGSDVVAELREPAPGCRTRFVAIWSDLDQLVLPLSGARIDHPDLDVRNVLAADVGHMSLPVDGRVVREVVATLARLDHDGHALDSAVASLDDRRTAHRGPGRAPVTAAPA